MRVPSKSFPSAESGPPHHASLEPDAHSGGGMDPGDNAVPARAAVSLGFVGQNSRAWVSGLTSVR